MASRDLSLEDALAHLRKDASVPELSMLLRLADKCRQNNQSATFRQTIV
jgi:hypothetical protein